MAVNPIQFQARLWVTEFLSDVAPCTGRAPPRSGF